MTLGLPPGSFPVRLRRLLSRPGLTTSSDAARSGGDGRSGAARSHAQRTWRGRRTPDLPAVRTVASSAPVGISYGGETQAVLGSGYKLRAATCLTLTAPKASQFNLI